MKGLFLFIFFISSLMISAQSQQGKVSIYSKELQDRVLASGDRFLGVENWAAHERLPINSRVELKNPENGKSVRLTIKDRGPFKIGYITQIPFQVAQQLNVQNGDTVKLRLIQSGNKNHTIDYRELVSSFDKTYQSQNDALEIRSSLSEGKFTLQVASFTNPKNAKKFVKRHQQEVSENLFILNPSTSVYKICAGRFKFREDADKAKSKFKKKYQSAFVYNLP